MVSGVCRGFGISKVEIFRLGLGQQGLRSKIRGSGFRVRCSLRLGVRSVELGV